MGLCGAIIVLPGSVPSGCTAVGALPAHYVAPGNAPESDFRLAASAYDHAKSCYDREYLFQFSEMDPNIHRQAEQQVAAAGSCTAGAAGLSSASSRRARLPLIPSRMSMTVSRACAGIVAKASSPMALLMARICDTTGRAADVSHRVRTRRSVG